VPVLAQLKAESYNPNQGPPSVALCDPFFTLVQSKPPECGFKSAAKEDYCEIRIAGSPPAMQAFVRTYRFRESKKNCLRGSEIGY